VDLRQLEIFLKVAKQGSTLAGVMDAFAIAISIGLQYGVPLKAYVDKFINMRFEPSGITDDPDFRFATSVVDYIFRRLAADYLEGFNAAPIHRASVKAIAQQAKLVVEPSGAAAVAALLADAEIERPVAAVLTGGNVDIDRLGSWLIR